MRSSSRPGVLAGSTLAAASARWTPGDLGSRTCGASVAISLAEEAREADERALLAIEQRVQDAQAAGYAAGKAEGAVAESNRLRAAVHAAESALDTIRENEAKWQKSVTANIAALAITVARHVVGRELRSDAAGVADLVKRALAEFPIDQPMRVRVNPNDLSLLSLPTADGGEPIPIAPNRDVRWMADARITPGGCVVEGRERIVDGRVDTALERLYRRLTDDNA